MENTQTFKAGLAVDLTVRITGGVEYKRTQKSEPRRVGTSVVEEWETEKTVAHPDEQKAAVTLRGDIRHQITRLCARTPLGDLLLIPPDREPDVRAALDAARARVDAHNAVATHHHLVMGCVLLRFVPEDEWTARSIRGEIFSVLTRMETGIGSADPEAIREAADAARRVLPMLTQMAHAYLDASIEEARRAAREIARRIVKEGESPEEVIAEIQESGTGRITDAMIYFAGTEEVKG
jgi:hypothetical protein